MDWQNVDIELIFIPSWEEILQGRDQNDLIFTPIVSIYNIKKMTPGEFSNLGLHS